MTRLSSAWRALTPDQRLAGGASAALFVTMFLPWYQQNAVVNAPRAAPLESRNLNAFQVFSFVEAAVLLVALAVLYLLFAAGIWVALLLVLRLFDKPGITTHGVAANVGIQWGIFFALAAAGLLAAAGSRMRAGARAEAPLVRRPRRPDSPRELEPPRARRARSSEPASQSPNDREAPIARVGRRPPAPRTAPPHRAPRRPVAVEDTTEQLSFEDHVSDPEPNLVSDPAPEPDQR